MRVELDARPEPVTIDTDRSAVVVVDMQNAFASKRGMLDLAGIDVSLASMAVEKARRVTEAARSSAIPIIYLAMGYPEDQSTAGDDDSPNRRKELALCLMRERPELRGKLLTFGTWDFRIVDELTPQPGDEVIVKSRYSGFVGTPLDSVLRRRGIRYLLMAGIASIQAVDAQLQIRSRLHCASTDANVPLSMSLPAISIGSGGQGGGAHTENEWYQPEGRELGLRRILLLLAALTTDDIE